MDENVPTMSLSLDEPNEIIPTPAAEPVAAAAAPPDAPPSPPVDADAEPVVYASNGEKLVPLKALQAERGKRKDAEALASKKDEEYAPLKEKAQKFDESVQYLNAARPYIEKLRANPDLVKHLQTGQPAPKAPSGPLSDQEALEYAKDFDLFKADGSPDVDRAQRIAQRHADLSARQAQQLVAPLAQNEAQRQTNTLFQHYVNRPEVNGIKVDAKMLAEAFNTVGSDNIAANPNIAEVLFMNTIGRQLLSGHKPIPVSSPPIVTESIGAPRAPETSFTDTDEKFYRASGMKRDAFTETRERYQAGRNNSLE